MSLHLIYARLYTSCQSFFTLIKHDDNHERQDSDGEVPWKQVRGLATSTDHWLCCCCFHQTLSCCQTNAFSSDPVAETYLNHSQKDCHNEWDHQTCILIVIFFIFSYHLCLQSRPDNPKLSPYTMSRLSVMVKLADFNSQELNHHISAFQIHKSVKSEWVSE